KQSHPQAHSSVVPPGAFRKNSKKREGKLAGDTYSMLGAVQRSTTTFTDVSVIQGYFLFYW
ncbi:hypothetical protein ACQP3C_28170, partial [Escherichia coli]